jgi:hypothetical protein
VTVTLRPERTLQALKAQLDLGSVHVTFTETRGGTELDVPVDPASLDLSGLDFEHGKGTLHVSGPLTLDYIDVRCVADIDLATLDGRGRLEIL